MRLKVRDALEELNGKALARLVRNRGIAGGRSDRAKITALTQSYRGDFEQLFRESTKADLVEMLNDVYTTDRGDLVRFKGLRDASTENLRVLAEKVFNPEWHPSTRLNDSSPVDGVTMVVESLNQWLDEADEDEWDEEEEEYASDSEVDLDTDEDVEEVADYEEWRKATVVEAGPGVAPPSPLERNERKLYEHQETALVKLRDWWRGGDGARRAGVLALPTGAGKTRTATVFALRDALASGKQVLWLAHRSELIDQAIQDFLTNGHVADRIFTVGRFQADKLKATAPVDILVASVSTLAWSGNQHVASIRSLLPRLGLIVVDECHHSVATTWRSLILSLRKRYADARLLGLTATPFRSQKSETNSFVLLYDENLLHSERALDLIDRGVLARPVVADVVRTGLTYRADARDAEEFRKWNDVPKGMVRRIGNDAGRNSIIVSHLVANQERYGKTLLFAASIDQAKAIQKSIPSSLTSELLTGASPAALRRDVLERFKSGDLQVLVNVDLLTEGTDVPAVKTVIIARPVASRGLFRQMVGRAMRGPRSGGNPTCNIVGFVDEIAGLVEDQFSATTPSFFSADEQYEAMGLDQPAVQELKASRNRVGAGPVKGYVVLPLAASPEGSPLLGWWEIESAHDKLCLPVFEVDSSPLAAWFEAKAEGQEPVDPILRFVASESLLRAREAIRTAIAPPRFIALREADAEAARIIAETLPPDVAVPPPRLPSVSDYAPATTPDESTALATSSEGTEESASPLKSGDSSVPLSFEGASPVDAAQSAPPAPPSPESPPPAKASRRRFAIGLAALAAGVVATGILVFTPRPPSDSNWSGAFVERTDPKFQHTVALHISGGTIEGTYFYNKRRQNLDLRGTLQGRRFTMEEFLSGKKTATFTGEFSSDWKTASGTWVHVDNGTTLNFQWSRGPQSAPLTR